MKITTDSNIKEVKISAKVIRCGCTEEEKTRQNWHALNNQPCPKPKNTDDLGVLAFNSKNALRMLKWKIIKFIFR